MIVDDPYAQTGTTHLWRRGLTFDASLAVALFDESLTDGDGSQLDVTDPLAWLLDDTEGVITGEIVP